MKVKWRAHGLILVTLIALIIITRYIWTAFIQKNGLVYYESFYKKSHLTFNKYENLLLPEIGSILLFYGGYLWLTFITIPVFLSAKQKAFLTYLWAGLQLLILGYLLALGINVATYYAKPFVFNYGPAFNLFALFGYNDQPLQHLFFGFSTGINLVLFYSIYAAIKEYIIYEAERSDDKAYRISAMNQTTAFWIIYITIPIFCLAFNLVKNDVIYRIYFALITIGIIIYIIQRNLRSLQLRRAEKALTRSKADLQFLRSQINPHFLFNVLNTLYGTALLDGSKKTAEGIQKLGDMMRFMLRDNHLDFIPMSSEVTYLKNYISLQKLRILLAENITIETNISEDNCKHLIAPMLLIPFVENAFKHGINPLERSWIKVNLRCNAQQIYFEVRNSVFPATENDPEEEYSGIGLQNVQERLNLFYNGKYQLNYGIQNEEFIAELIIDTTAKPLRN